MNTDFLDFEYVEESYRVADMCVNCDKERAEVGSPLCIYCIEDLEAQSFENEELFLE